MAGWTFRGLTRSSRIRPPDSSRSARARRRPTLTSRGPASSTTACTWSTRRSGGTRTDALCFVGRVAEEKGIVDAIEVAKAAGRPLKIAAKIGPVGPEKDYNDAVFQPALKAAGKDVEFLGELSQSDRDQLFAESYATLMPGSWPEPFGLVAIEALACGTPIVARRSGALPEIIRDGIDGFFGDDVMAMAFKVDRVEDLDRQAIRDSVVNRFSVERMTDGYEAIYRRMLGAPSRVRPPIAVMDEEIADRPRTAERTEATTAKT